ETNSPDDDFDRLIEFLMQNAESLRIDKSKVGIWACSANTVLAMNKVSKLNDFKCISIFYGLTITSGSEHYREAEELSKKNGFTFLPANEYTSTIPTLVVRAGKDSWIVILKAINEFVWSLMTNNKNFELINYPDGQHGFDIFDDTMTSKEIIVRTIEFFKKELNR
ncbi:MAG TPA: hypothetical protein VFN95_06530, partial [Flavitalea sp.]|nr:hypothetical protein [Flavitalea sp.]